MVCETSCEEHVDPLILDLKNNGIAFTDRDHGVKFDMNAVGRLQKISWTTKASDDAFLFIDLNENGKIDNGSELFSNFTKLADNFYAADGFKALAGIDTNFDGIYRCF